MGPQKAVVVDVNTPVHKRIAIRVRLIRIPKLAAYISPNNKMLVPVTMLTGSCVALLCNMLMVVPGSNTILPLNAVTPMLGAPVIIYVIVNRKNIQYFN